MILVKPRNYTGEYLLIYFFKIYKYVAYLYKEQSEYIIKPL